MSRFTSLLSVAVLAAALAPAAALARGANVSDPSQPARHLIVTGQLPSSQPGGRAAQNANVPVALATAPGAAYASADDIGSAG